MTEYTWEPLTEMPEVGDEIKRVESLGGVLTEGETYEVLMVRDGYFYVVGDGGTLVKMHKSLIVKWLIRKPVVQPIENISERIGKTITQGMNALEKVRREALKPKGKPAKQSDNVNSPSHYTAGNIETIDYIQDKLTPEQFEGYCIGNVHKYISRYKLKNGKEDLKKAAWYLNKAVEHYGEANA